MQFFVVVVVVAAGWVSPWSPGLGPWERCPHSIQTERIRANYWLRNQLEIEGRQPMEIHE